MSSERKSMDDKVQSKSPSNTTKDAVAKVHDVAEQARSAATERVELVREQADSVKAKAADRVRKLGHAVRKIGEHMRIEDQLYIAEHAQDASQRLESVASYIDDTDVGTLIQDAESVARRNPAWVVGGTFLIGLAAGRVLKAPSAAISEVRSDRSVSQLPATGEERATSASERRSARVQGNGDDGPRKMGMRP
jgi:hypothetical protein